MYKDIIRCYNENITSYIIIVLYGYIDCYNFGDISCYNMIYLIAIYVQSTCYNLIAILGDITCFNMIAIYGCKIKYIF